MKSTTITDTADAVTTALLAFVAEAERLAVEADTDAAAVLELIEAAEHTIADTLIAATGAHDGFDGVGDQLHRLLATLVPQLDALAAVPTA
jgi:hypothetical protein